MPVIKSGKGIQARPFSMQDIERHARALIADAQTKAQQIVADAQAQADKIRNDAKMVGTAQGRDDGLAKGLEQGREQGRADAVQQHSEALQQLIGLLQQMAQQLNGMLINLESSAHADVAELALNVARRVTRRVAQIDPEVLAENLREAVALVVSCNDLRIVVNPQQHQLLDETLQDLQTTFPNLEHVRIQTDESMSPGGCVVHTARGEVNAGIDAQLQNIVDQVLPPQEATAEPAVGSAPQADTSAPAQEEPSG